jgi:hypothetical protein
MRTPETSNGTVATWFLHLVGVTIRRVVQDFIW